MENKSYSSAPKVSRVLLRETPSRSISVGYPNLFNYCFDSVSGTPLYVWTGDFIDLLPEIKGRGGRECAIIGSKKELPFEKYPFRVNSPDSMPQQIDFLGYTRPKDNSAPVFEVKVDEVIISLSLQSFTPDLVEIDLEIDNRSKKKLYLKLTEFDKAKVILSENLCWQSNQVIFISSDVINCKISLNLQSVEGLVEVVQQMSGKTLYATYCSACHSLDGSKSIGPSLKGIIGKEETVIVNGKEMKITVNSEYLKRSILKPQEELVKGYEQVAMPSFENILKPEEIRKVVEFLKSIKK